MSHLSTLSDFVGKIKNKSNSQGQEEESSDKNSGNKDTRSTTNILRLDDDEMRNMFSGMSRSLGKSGARIARNKKIIKRNIQQQSQPSEVVDEDISALSESRNWDYDSSIHRMESKEDTGWDTDLEIEEVMEGFDHSGKTAYIEACQRNHVVPVSYYLRHMHDSELKLKHHQLGHQAMKPIAISLVSNAKILALDLTDNAIGYQGCSVLCDMLRENCFITKLNLSENRLGPESAQLLSDIMTVTTTLTHVTLSNNQFDDRAAVNFAEAILNTAKIQYLNLSHNLFAEQAGVILGPAIAENTTIKELDLSWNSIRRKGAAAIANGIRQNIMIKKLNLSWNGFGLDGMKELGKALAENTTLEELDVTNNRITTEGAVHFGKGLAASESLIKVKIGKNPMQSAGCWAICSAVLKNSHMHLRELNFEDILVNKDFKDIKQDVMNLIPDIKIHHGGLEPPKKPKARVHPMTKLQNYITKNNLKLIDFFQKFDTDGSMSVSHAEFREGLEELGINLDVDEIDILIEELDKDGDGEINYSELVIGNQEFTENAKRDAAKVLKAFNPQPVSVLKT